MIKEKQKADRKNKLFQALGQQSPEMKTFSPPEDRIQELTLEQPQITHEKPIQRSRRHKIKSKQTNVIKIKPVKRQTNENQQNEIQLNPASQGLIQFAEDQETNDKSDKNTDNFQNFQSPVLYKISDEQDNQNLPNQQPIPQSSRRPLYESQKSIKKTDSDEPDSPLKLLKSPRKQRSKQKNIVSRKKSPHKRFRIDSQDIMIQNQVIKVEQKVQKTEVYEYQDQNVSVQSQQLSQEQQNDTYDIKDSKEQQFKRPSKTSAIKKSQQAKQIVFKSNSFYTLINAQIPLSNFVNCIIKRRRGEEYFQKIVTFECYLLEDKKYLMTCIKDRLFKTTSHFQFYREKSGSNKYHGQNMYGYLDSNFTGTQFVLKTLQRNDTNSQRSTTIDKSDVMKLQESTAEVISQKGPQGNKLFSNKLQDSVNLHNENQGKQTCYMSFKTSFFGLSGQRQVKILKKKNKKLIKTDKFSDIKSAQENGQIDKYTQIHSKKASMGKNGLELDFKGIAKMQSTKNIILQNQNNKQVLRFGKIKQDIYMVSIGHPLSILEGLAFGIANLDRKFFVN